MDIQSFIYSIDWANPSWDLFIVIIFIAGIFLYTLSLGKDKVLIILISSYISLALLSKFSLISSQLGLGLDNSFPNSVAFFIGGILIIFLMLSNSVFTSVFDQGSGGTWFQTVVVSFLQIGLMISLVVSFLPVEETNALSPLIRTVFSQDQSQLIWLTAPIIAVLLFKK